MPSLKRTLLYVGLIVVVTSVMVAVAPVERTMGEGIRAVYVHVALTVAAVVGFGVEAVLGVIALATGSRPTARWLRAVAGVALGLFAAGTFVSAVAAWINWGGMFLDEPLFRSSIVVLAFGFLLYAVMSWTEHARLHGALGLGPLIAIVWALAGTRAALHPGASVIPESVGSIQATFAALTVLCVAAGGRLAWQLGSRRPERTDTAMPVQWKFGWIKTGTFISWK